MKYLIIALTAFFLLSCAGDNESESNIGEDGVQEKYFPEFPGAHFHDVILGTSYTVVERALEDNGYKSTDDQNKHFVNEELQTEVVLGENDLLWEFKVFFFSNEDLKDADKFKAFFSDYANEEHVSPEFCIYTFTYFSQVFSVTLFEQPDFIRLHYELKSAP